MKASAVDLNSIFPPSRLSDADKLTFAGEISPHLARLFRIYHDDLPAIHASLYDDILTNAKSKLIEDLTAASDDAEYMAAIRFYRGRISHMVAVTDFLDLADVHQHMQWLSAAAETALSALADALAGDDDVKQGWFILALGKLGAQELNYSSDIDLIVITLNDYEDYDATKRYIRLTRQITSLMSQPTKDGIGWRVDLRLRPDPGATAVAIQRDAALSYYESIARTWERAAFIRARPVAGNIAAGMAFLDDLQPFIWRRYLDYTVLEDLKVMLRREPRPDRLLGHNIKNGVGGIRSIEFFVHAHQLIAGGREKKLRLTSTPTAIAQLAKNSWITDEDAARLQDAYGIWRRLEHRLQMIGDAQTHQMPKSDEAFTAFARFCGHDDCGEFRQSLITLGDDVIAATQGLMTRLHINQSESSGASANEDFDETLPYISEDLDATHQRLTELGFTAPQTITSTCEAWMAGRISATRSPRSRDLLLKLLPRLLAKFAEQEHPDAGFIAFAQLVERLPAGLQLFSLIDSHEDIAQMIVAISSSAPVLAEQISRHPILADALLYNAFWQAEEDWPAREAELHDSLNLIEYYENKLDGLRRQCREWQFRTSAQLLQGTIDGTRAGKDYTAIADAIINCALPIVAEEMERRFGQIAGGISIYALGRCGSGEMTLTSDLDLLFVFDAPADALSDGKRQLGGSQYYARFGQELITALSTLTAEGRCYEVDMRLRPSGNKGPVSVHIDGFEKYQREDAWTWEHLALMKSRHIGGYRDEMVLDRMNSLVPKIIKMKRPPEALVDDICSMREKLMASRPAKSPHDLRQRAGGVMDIDFIIQMLQMMPAAIDLPVYRRSADAITPLKDCGLLNEDEAELLAKTIVDYTDLIQWMRLTGIRTSPADNPQTPVPPSAQKRFNLKTFEEFDAAIDGIANPIIQITKKYVCKDEKKA